MAVFCESFIYLKNEPYMKWRDILNIFMCMIVYVCGKFYKKFSVDAYHTTNFHRLIYNILCRDCPIFYHWILHEIQFAYIISIIQSIYFHYNELRIMNRRFLTFKRSFDFVLSWSLNIGSKNQLHTWIYQPCIYKHVHDSIKPYQQRW